MLCIWDDPHFIRAPISHLRLGHSLFDPSVVNVFNNGEYTKLANHWRGGADEVDTHGLMQRCT